MSSVLGVSVGAGAVRMARPHLGNPGGPIGAHAFDLQHIAVNGHPMAELTAQAIGVTVASSPEPTATAIAYRSEEHAHGIRAAMARQQLTNYELVPEVVAALEFAEATGDIRGISSLVVYDLGSSGLSVSVVDTQTREVRYSERTSDISGDYLDSLIREQQIASGRIAHPQDPAGLAALDALCCEAKEQLSINTAVALPSEHGLVLLAQENFEALIMLAIESSARMARDVIVRSDRPVHGVLAIGGCARIPLIPRVLERWMGVPVIVPESPETVMARGAALLARQLRPSRQVAPAPVPGPAAGPPGPDELSPAWLSAPPKKHGKRGVSAAVLTVSALAVVAAIGLGLGYGPQVLTRDSQSTDKSTPSPTTTAPRTTTLEPQIVVSPAPTTESEVPAAPPPRRAATTTPPPPEPGPNTIVVPGLPPIVVPTIPPVIIPGFPGPGQ
ncbi:Hsp70 family protein [Nocardia arthritidis]|uniref:Hsp70 family protein n=1 Tax=Nocardia arthritidis TaxID=228602 RepID=A0A6G9YSX2_9NOCA|nr:Hsp70 family protein [Nocardia arthritidis]QIS16415.1 Hsp70 family protein [Nocardia arthritidis]